MALAKSLRNTGILFTDRRDFYISPNVVKELWTDISPFTTIVSNRAMRGTTDPDFKMFEHRGAWIKQQFSLNDSTPTAWTVTGAPGDTVVQVIDGIVGLASTPDDSYIGLELEVYDSTLATYKGVVLVTAVSGSSITFKALGNPAQSSDEVDDMADNDVFQVIGNAFGEGTVAAEGWSDDLSVVWGSSQIFKTAVEVTGTLYAAALRGYSNELARLRVDKNREHKMQKERALLFGVRSGGINLLGADTFGDNHQADANSKKVRTTMGIIAALRKYGSATGDGQNLFTINSATYAYPQFVDDMEKVFQYLPNSGYKTALCGAQALSYWSKIGLDSGFVKKSGFSVQLSGMQRDSLGFNFRELITPHGVLRLVYAPALRGPYRNRMVIIDDSNLEYVQYRGSMYQTNIKTDNAYDGVKDQYFSDEGLGIQMIETHSLWTIN